MKIAVIGAGAMGSLYGAHLAGAGEDVFLVNIWEEHVNAINRQGLTISTDSGDRTVGLRAVTDASSVGPVDLILIFVKSNATGEAARTALELVREDTFVLTLQNGIGNVEKLVDILGPDRVLAGTSAFGGTMLGPGRIRHAGSGPTMLGEISGKITPRLEELVRVFQRAGLQPTISDNIQGVLWTKLIVNVGINALTALARVKNGQLLEIPELEELMGMAVAEAVAVAAKKNIKLVTPDPLEHVKNIARATGQNISSMRQDVEKGRLTEIDVINGAVCREGDILGIPTPVNRVLTMLVKAVSAV
ncbi:MAG: ketopantoate reductase family protein [Bacillota bacterium]